MLTYPGSLSQEERTRDRLAGGVTRNLVAQERTHECGFVTLTLGGSDASVCLDDRIVGRCATHRAFSTEPRDCSIDELGVDTA